MTDPGPKPILSYDTPPATPVVKSSWVAAFVLALPGACCWMGLVSAEAPRTGPFVLLRWPGAFLMQTLGFGMIFVWMLAILTALISVITYLPRPKPWYVILNLVVNISGLLFSAVIVAMAIFHR